MGLKAFEKAKRLQEERKAGKKAEDGKTKKPKKKGDGKKSGSSSKGAPIEVTSKKPVARFRHVIEGTAEVRSPLPCWSFQVLWCCYLSSSFLLLGRNGVTPGLAASTVT